ncbi:MAG: RNA polymerase sigma factor [Actinomycetota bacterium]|nr:RNA polymerase sigma factor [Actinomycetota bacterium]
MRVHYARETEEADLLLTKAQRDGEHEELVALEPEIRRVVAARVHDQQVVDDLVQEVLARVLGALPRLGDRALAPYAVVTARNLVSSLRRTELREQRHRHRLVDLRTPENPEQVALQRIDERAVASALDRLSCDERDIVMSHEVMDIDTRTIAERHESSPGAVATRLARLRARLRVDYLLALRTDEPPTSECRSILVAMSAGDTRRQAALGAGKHLMNCAFCAELSDPVLRRRRPAAAFIPVAVGAKAFGALGRFIRSPLGKVTGGVVAAGAAVAVSVAIRNDAPVQRSSSVMAGERLVLPVESDSEVARYVGERVDGRDSRVQSVPADEGFWIGGNAANRIFVRLVGPNESRVRIGPDQRVSFVGTMVSHGTAFAGRVGVIPVEGSEQLTRQGAHVEVVFEELEIAK